MSKTYSIDEMADAINKGLQEYADLAATEMKSAVRKSAKTVKEQISENAPVRTGKYAKSWVAKTTEENSQKLVQTVCSPDPVYAGSSAGKRSRQAGRRTGGGKAPLAPAEEAGVELLQRLIEKALSD